MDTLLEAIVDDDRPRVAKLLRTDPALATRLIEEARLHDSKIFHWIYVGDTALHLAAAGYRVEIVRGLLAAGAEINAQDKNGAAPLHRAVRTRCAAAVQRLLKAGADPTLKNNSGSTPFHLAVQDTGRGGSGADEARAAQRQIIGEFLSFGVSRALTDGKGKSVLDCARSGWIREMLSWDATER